MIQNYSGVYYVESILPVNPIAIGPQVDEKKKQITWDDTSRGFSVNFEQIINSPDELSKNPIPQEFTVKTKDGSYKFRYLTLTIYDQHVRNQVCGRPKFTSTDELQEFYRNF